MALHIARTASLVRSNQNLITVPTNDSDYIVDHGHGRPVTSREFFGFPYIEEPSFTAFGPQSGRFACEDPDITAESRVSRAAAVLRLAMAMRGTY